MAELGVVHLVRAQNGLQPFASFLESYTRNSGGVPHDLLIAFKGFPDDAALGPYRDRLKNLAHREVRVSDVGLDLRAYYLACRHFDYPYLCFLNSYSTPLEPGWLEKLFVVVQQPQVGVVGAAGSWESMYTNLINARATGGPLPFPRRLMTGLRLQVNRRLFRPFPNYHLRTNAFMLSRQLMLDVWPRFILSKTAAYMFENGHNNFMQRVLRRGLKPLVVGRDGRSYEKEEWARSNTFRQSNQENLLVADNQTRNYANADFAQRKILSSFSWGNEARPAQP